MKDLFGKAMLDYFTNDNPANIYTSTSISTVDEMETSYMFRDFAAMPKLEKKALNLCYGKILDVGCGAGSHALYIQNEKKLSVTAIDFSANAIETCKLRGLDNAIVADFFSYKNDKKYDTILMLMNGTGICGKLSNISPFLQQIKSLLNDDGQVLIDSTDIRYMYDKDRNRKVILPFGMEYFGELQFYLTYKEEQEIPFNWLYLDYETFHSHAIANGFICEKIFEGKHSEYLAILKIAKIDFVK